MYPGQQNGPPTTLQDPLRLPRRQMDPEDFLEILRRNKSWVAGPILAGIVIAVVVAFLWPDTFQSTAVIRVVPPQVPERLVPSNINTEMSQRIQSMAQTILSRGTLTSIIETYGLYARDRKQLPLEDIIESMQRDIRISPVQTIQAAGTNRGQTLTAFQVTFAYENRYLAQKVAGDIVSRFINENTRERANQAAMTTQFLKDQWQMAKNELDQMEQKLTDFRIRHAGQLPDQWPVRMQQMSALETRATTLNGSISRHNQEKLLLEGEIRALRERVTSMMQVGEHPEEFVDPQVSRMDTQIRSAQQQLDTLMEAYKPTHPDVVRYKAQLELLRRDRERYLGNRQDPASGRPVLSEQMAKEIRDLNTRIYSLQSQVRAKDLQMEDHTREIEKIGARIGSLQQQLQTAPIGEQEYTALLRDYELAKQRYDDLNVRMMESQIATDLENRKQGETLELLDPASLPETPSEPQRSMIIALGVAAGLGLGVALVFVREMKDSTLKTLKDVRAYTQLPVMSSVPLLENDLVVMRRKRMSWLMWTAASALSAVTMAGAVYYYYVTKV
ncbi:MAG: hypothetical protein GY953_02960 [bacterium]|nr:hypothetical protein [bacterium]